MAEVYFNYISFLFCFTIDYLLISECDILVICSASGFGCWGSAHGEAGGCQVQYVCIFLMGFYIIYFFHVLFCFNLFIYFIVIFHLFLKFCTYK